jgi:hypothetical protein
MTDKKLLEDIASDLSTFIAIAGPIPVYDCPLKQAADNLDRLTDALEMKRYRFLKDQRRYGEPCVKA